MLLKASQRGGGTHLANHLLNANDNDHVTVHELSGFMTDDVHGAFKEMHAISKGTNCKQYMFSLSLNPPMNETVSTDEFIEVVDRVGQELGLADQPRVIVFHEKENRLHAHAVFSRIDSEQLRGINLPFFKNRLNEISRDIYLEKGWELPKGFIDKQACDPLNYSLEEYSQAKRLDRNPKALKAILKSCWEKSDNRASFEAAIKEQGFFLARGDRRGFVAVTMTGEPLSLSRWLGVKTKELKTKLGDKEALKSIDQINTTISKNLNDKFNTHQNELNQRKTARLSPLQQKRRELINTQKQDRETLSKSQAERIIMEAKERDAKFRTGVFGVWDRFTGRHKKTLIQNREEIKNAEQRDKQERDNLIQKQLRERRQIISRIQAVRSEFQKGQDHLYRVIGRNPSHNELSVERQNQNQKSKHRNHFV